MDRLRFRSVRSPRSLHTLHQVDQVYSYDAQRGLLWSHIGWIFYKPKYEKTHLIDKKDLEADPVVRVQHKYYISLSIVLGFILPTLLGACWGDALGGYIWGGVVARLLYEKALILHATWSDLQSYRIWHCTFCINSLAHYLGDQPYSEDVTARGNYILAILTGGEASHNFHHAFPQDYRNGPNPLDWDPTKLLIWFFHKFTNQVPCVRQTDEADILKARAQVLQTNADRIRPKKEVQAEALPIWRRDQVQSEVQRLIETRMSTGSLSRPLVVIIDGYAVDACSYAKDHPGGVTLLRNFAVVNKDWQDASTAFNGGYNIHGSAAKLKMKGLRIAKIEG